jgi:hypothetical protein
VRRGIAVGAVLVVVATAAGGCGGWTASWSWPPWQRPGGEALALADHHVERGEYAQAVAAYDAYLTKYPEEPEAKRALQTRDTLAAIVAARAELERLRAELAKSESDATRLRDELARLRADLERLKQLDLGLERRR